MRSQQIACEFKTHDRVRCEQGDYAGQTGIVVRIGTAGPLTYVHVRLDGMSTPITFVAERNELRKDTGSVPKAEIPSIDIDGGYEEKSVDVDTTSLDDLRSAISTSRKRGRPPGSKNKKTSVPTSTPESAPSSAQGQIDGVTKTSKTLIPESGLIQSDTTRTVNDQSDFDWSNIF